MQHAAVERALFTDAHSLGVVVAHIWVGLLGVAAERGGAWEFEAADLAYVYGLLRRLLACDFGRLRLLFDGGALLLSSADHFILRGELRASDDIYLFRFLRGS